MLSARWAPRCDFIDAWKVIGCPGPLLFRPIHEFELSLDFFSNSGICVSQCLGVFPFSLRFAIAGDSDILGRPVSSLAGYTQLIVPVHTIVYAKSFSRFHLAEAAMTINGKDVWYYPYKVDGQFQEGKGLVIRFPLAARRSDDRS